MVDKRVQKHNQSPVTISRRGFIAGTAASATVAATRRPAFGLQPKAKYRVAVIGHTGHGNYGHGIDRVWLEVPETEIVAVADADKSGLAAAVKRLKAPKGYADYRQMLDESKPDLVAVGPRWLDQHRDMVVAAAQSGARGIYTEKPFCRTMAEADEMLAACGKNKVKLAIAFQTRYSPVLPVVSEIIESGQIGQVLELRGQGKSDRRGGGEDLWVLGTHVFNLMNHFGGQPLWCFGSVEQDGKPITKEDVKPGAEGIGLLAGDTVHAMWRMSDGPTAYFDSVRNMGGRPSRFGLWICGSKGVIELHTGYLPAAYLLSDPAWSPGRTGKKWLPITSAGVDKPEPLPNTSLHGGNILAVKDLLAAIEEDRQPLADIHAARTSTEMIASVFESQRLGKPVALPLANRQCPLSMM